MIDFVLKPIHFNAVNKWLIPKRRSNGEPIKTLYQVKIHLLISGCSKPAWKMNPNWLIQLGLNKFIAEVN